MGNASDSRFRRMWTKRLFLAAAAAAAVVTPSTAAGGPQAQTGPAAGPPQAPPGWTRFEDFPGERPLKNSTRVTVKGKKDEAGGCTFKVELKLPLNAKAVQGRERARNVQTCEQVVEIGTPDPADVEARPEATADLQTLGERKQLERETDKPGADRRGRFLSAKRQSTFWSAGYMHTWWRDPIYLHVNDVYNDVSWQWGDYCVGWAWSGYYLTWLTATGWRLNSHWWFPRFTCDYVSSTSYAHFKNPYFCAFFDTDAWYQPNAVYGWWDGWLTGYVYSYITGSWCGYMLSGRYELVRTIY